MHSQSISLDNTQQLHNYTQQIQTTKQRISLIYKQIEHERNKRLILDQLELDDVSDVGESSGRDYSIGREDGQDEKDGQDGRGSRVLGSVGDCSQYSVSSRDIVDQFENIRRYMQQQPKHQSRIDYHQPKQPNISTHTYTHKYPIINPKQPYPHHPQTKQQPSAYSQTYTYKHNTHQYLKHKIKQNIDNNIGNQFDQSNVEMKRTRRRKSIFNNNNNNNSTTIRQQQQLTKQQQICKNIANKYKQFQYKQQSTYNNNKYNPQQQIYSQSRQQQYNILPANDKKHWQCLQMLNRDTQKYRKMLKFTYKQSARCMKLRSTIREISVYQRILSNNIVMH